MHSCIWCQATNCCTRCSKLSPAHNDLFSSECWMNSNNTRWSAGCARRTVTRLHYKRCLHGSLQPERNLRLLRDASPTMCVHLVCICQMLRQELAAQTCQPERFDVRLPF